MTAALAWLILCAVLNRWRGSGTVQVSLTVKRAAISAAFSLPVAVTSPALAGVVFLLVWWVGFAPGWGAYFDLSDRPNPPEVGWIDRAVRGLEGVRRDYFAMTLRGLMLTVPAALVVAWWAPAALLLAPFGALMAPVYFYAHRLRLGIAGAEVAFGAVLGAVYFDLGAILALT